MRYIVLGLFSLLLWSACTGSSASNPSGLPFMGFRPLVEKEINGEKVIDTADYVVSGFTFVNQDSTTITEKDVKGKIYIADFFFTSCPTICPKVKKNMKKVYKQFKDKEDFLILSHSIDTKYDTVGRLAWYADKFNISSDTWHLLTGEKEHIYQMAGRYLIAALESEDAPGGFDHSGGIALMDRNRRIRGMYDGTDPAEVDDLIRDIQLLMDKE